MSDNLSLRARPTMRSFYLHLLQIAACLAVVSTATPIFPSSDDTTHLRVEPGETPQSKNLTSNAMAACSTTPNNWPEDRVHGQTNLFWTYCYISPLVPLPQSEVDSLLSDLIQKIYTTSDPNLQLDASVFEETADHELRIGIGPSAVGTGPHERSAADWFITNTVVLVVLTQLQAFLKVQPKEMGISEFYMYVYEKGTSRRVSRGTVVSCTLARNG